MDAEFVEELYECVKEALESLGDDIHNLDFFCTEEESMAGSGV